MPAGAGKSTLINYLCGVQLKPETISGRERFVVTDENGVAGIKGGAVSATLLPGVHATDDGVLTDCPGLFDTRAPAVNVANGINVAACADAASEAKIVLLIEFASAHTNRGGVLKGVFLALAESLGGVKGLKGHAESILFLVSKAPPTCDVVNARKQLAEATKLLNEEERSVALELFERAELYHPLDQGHATWIKLSTLKNKIKGLKPISEPGSIYRSPLSFADEKLLREITNELVTTVTRNLSDQRGFPLCADSLAALERLNVVNLRIVHVLVANAMSQVRAHVERFFTEAQQYLFNDHFDDASRLAQQMRALATALCRSGPTSGSALAADLARSLNLRVGELETLIEHRQLEEQRFVEAQREQKDQSNQTAMMQAKLDKLELINRGLASQLESVQNELMQAQEEAIMKARQLEATFMEKNQALEDCAARGEKKEESTAEAAALREEMDRELKVLHEEAAAKEEAIQRSIEEQKALAKKKEEEEAALRHNIDSAEAKRRRQSLNARQEAVAAAAVEAAERKVAELTHEAQKKAKEAAEKVAMAATAASQAVSVTGEESPSTLRAEGEARAQDLEARHGANLEALKMAAEAQTKTREAQLAQTLIPLEISLQKARDDDDDFDPEAAERIWAHIEEAQTAAAAANAVASKELAAACAKAAVQHSHALEKTKLLYEPRAAKIEEIRAARAALATAMVEQSNKPKAAEEAFELASRVRAADFEAAAQKKMAEAKETTRKAVKAEDYTEAKALKAEAKDLKQKAIAAAAGEDEAGIQEKNEMVQAVQALEAAVVAAKANLERLENEMAVLPKTTRALEELQPYFEKRKAMRHEVVELWTSGNHSAASKLVSGLLELPWSISGVASAHAAEVSAAAKEAAVVQVDEASAQLLAGVQRLAAEVESASLAEKAAVLSQAEEDTLTKTLAAEVEAALQAEKAAPVIAAAAQLDPKSSMQVCNLCGTEMSAFTYSLVAPAKHRCKCCGHVFCAPCLPAKISISGYPTPKRVCSPCIEAHELDVAKLKAARVDAEKRSAAAQEAMRLKGAEVAALKTALADAKQRSSAAQEAAQAAAVKVAQEAAQRAIKEDAASAPELSQGSAAVILASLIEEATSVGHHEKAAVLQNKKDNNEMGEECLLLAIALDAFPWSTIVRASEASGEVAAGTAGEVIGHTPNGKVEVRFKEGDAVFGMASLQAADLPNGWAVHQTCFAVVEIAGEVTTGQKGTAVGWSKPFDREKILADFGGRQVNVPLSQIETNEERLNRLVRPLIPLQ